MLDTLYISDLDGTLLNSNAEISEYTKNQLNILIAKGMNFSIATARTYATAIKMLEGININVPVILMNGVCIYDTTKNEYVNIESISKNALEAMINVIHKYKLAGFLYSIDNNSLNTFYENLNSPNAVSFLEEREKKFGKIFTKISDFKTCIRNNVVYYSISNIKQILEPAYKELKKNSELHIEFYRDIYNENYWYLEICSNSASKYNAVCYLKEKYNFKNIIGFGDNLNDLPLFKICDESYAVENAKDEVKIKATAVISSNNNDGVVKQLVKLCNR